MRASTPKGRVGPKTPGTGPAFLPSRLTTAFFRDMQKGSMCLGSSTVPAPAWVFNDAYSAGAGAGASDALGSATGLAWLSGDGNVAEASAAGADLRGTWIPLCYNMPLPGMAAPCCSGTHLTRGTATGFWPSKGRAVRRFRAVAIKRGGTGPGAQYLMARPCAFDIYDAMRLVIGPVVGEPLRAAPLGRWLVRVAASRGWRTGSSSGAGRR